MSDALLKFCLLCLTACIVHAYATGNWLMLAAGVAACYVGWLVNRAGKDVDKKLEELHRKRLVQPHAVRVACRNH